MLTYSSVEILPHRLFQIEVSYTGDQQIWATGASPYCTTYIPAMGAADCC
jgi:hypothetical protein